VIDERDKAIAELANAGVVSLAGFNDANGNPAYRLLGFPPGERGRELEMLFDQHIQGRGGMTRAGGS